MLEQAGYKVLAGLCAAIASFAAVYQVSLTSASAERSVVSVPSSQVRAVFQYRIIVLKLASPVQILAHLRNYNGPVFQVGMSKTGSPFRSEGSQSSCPSAACGDLN